MVVRLIFSPEVAPVVVFATSIVLSLTRVLPAHTSTPVAPHERDHTFLTVMPRSDESEIPLTETPRLPQPEYEG